MDPNGPQWTLVDLNRFLLNEIDPGPHFTPVTFNAIKALSWKFPGASNISQNILSTYTYSKWCGGGNR